MSTMRNQEVGSGVGVSEKSDNVFWEALKCLDMWSESTTECSSMTMRWRVGVIVSDLAQAVGRCQKGLKCEFTAAEKYEGEVHR